MSETNAIHAESGGVRQVHTSPPKWQRIVTKALPTAALGALAFVLVMAATEPPGPGLDPDALSYLGAAESLVHQGAYQIPTAEWISPDTAQPLAHFPPGYSTVLAIPIALGMRPVQGARWVDALAACATTILLVLLVSSASNMITAALLAVALFAMTSMHEVHISVLSEPLYLLWLMLTLTAMVRWPARPLRAGIPAALAVMTRYAGISVVAGVAVWVMWNARTWRERITRAVIAVLPAAVLQLLWVLRTEHAHDAEEIRRFSIYGDMGPTLRQGLATLSAWLVPNPTDKYDILGRGVIAFAVSVVLVALMLIGYSWFKWFRNVARIAHAPTDGDATINVATFARYEMIFESVYRAFNLVHASLLLIACYLGVVLASRLLADPLIPLDERILAPAILLMMIVIAVTMGAWWHRSRLLSTRVAVTVMLVIWWIAAAGATWNEARYALTWGSDFAGQDWRTSELIAWTRKNASRTQLYTNWPAAVYFYLHRNSHELPRRADEQTLAAFGDSVRARHGVVLLFGPENGEYIPSDSLYNVPGLEKIKELKDGAVLAPVKQP